MNTQAFLDHVQRQPWYRRQIVHTQVLPPRAARHQEPRHTLPLPLRQRLEALGLWPLYAHQAEAIDAVAEGANIVVATPAASGKSQCYHLPVIASVLLDRGSRALYLYPTKALAQNQLLKLRGLTEGLPAPVRFTTYDGDTPSGERGEARRSAHILLTNPDMLHLGLLPNRQSWRDFLSRLRYVVLDESHVYRGVFGSHVAQVLRRLRRLCALYGSNPQFILCSATIANPQEHAEALAGLPFRVIDQDGAPFSGKDFVLWNPPLVDEAKAVRRSPNTDATFLFGDLLQQQVRTITFSGTRKVAELLYIYVRDRFRQEAPALADRVRPYRAGYLAEHRREIERGLFEGSLLGVSATNALELGIDIGDLDATVMTGYPGTIASTWQQAGRSGRRSERSLSVLVASDNPLDQYLMRHPEAFFERPQEHALISAANPHILQPHLLCAAYESPLTAKDGAIFGDAMWPLVQRLERRGLLQEGTGSRWFPSTDTLYPAEEVNIRSTAHRLYQVVEESSGTLLETMDSSRVYSQAHPGAVYLHQGDAYIVTRLDHQAGTAWVKAHAEPYYTVPRDHTEISIVKAASQAWVNGVRVSLGEVDVANTVVGFKRKRQFTEEVLDDEPLEMPTQSFVTVALWWDIPEPARVHVDRMGLDFEGGLHACEHAAIGMLPLFAMCDRADIGGVSTALHPDTGKPQIFIYDGHPGGIGIAEKGYELVAGLWEATLRTILECPCESGCPSCIQSPKCGNNNNPLDKTAAAIILEHLLDADSRPAAGRRSA